MPAIGAPSRAHLRKVYTIAAVMAGIAGALLTQTTSTVSLEVLCFQRSADVLVILILGGAGRLYGGIVGAIIYMVARDQFSGINPAVLVFLDRPAAGRGGDVPAQRHPRRPRATRRAAAADAVRDRAGALHARARQALRLARGRAGHRSRAAAGRALRADRPERRRQDHADQPDDRHAARRTPGRSFSAARRSPRSSPRRASSAASPAPSRSTRSSPHLSALEAVTLAVCERDGRCRDLVAAPAGVSQRGRRRLRHPRLARARRRLLPADARARLRPAAAARDRARARHAAEGPAARRAGGRGAARTRARRCSTAIAGLSRRSRCSSSSTT